MLEHYTRLAASRPWFSAGLFGVVVGVIIGVEAIAFGHGPGEALGHGAIAGGLTFLSFGFIRLLRMKR
jgi:hypothetical protein